MQEWSECNTEASAANQEYKISNQDNRNFAGHAAIKKVQDMNKFYGTMS
jgi:hypothetical protein